MKPVVRVSFLKLSLILSFWSMAFVTGRHLHFNIGESLAGRLFWYRHLSDTTPLPRGAIVVIHPPETVLATLHTMAPAADTTHGWLKTIGAVAGQTICWTTETFSIEGIASGSLPLLEDYPITPQQGCTTLRPDDLFVVGTHPRSYDSRYIGPLSRQTVTGVCQRVW